MNWGLRDEGWKYRYAIGAEAFTLGGFLPDAIPVYLRFPLGLAGRLLEQPYLRDSIWSAGVKVLH